MSWYFSVNNAVLKPKPITTNFFMLTVFVPLILIVLWTVTYIQFHSNMRITLLNGVNIILFVSLSVSIVFSLLYYIKKMLYKHYAIILEKYTHDYLKRQQQTISVVASDLILADQNKNFINQLIKGSNEDDFSMVTDGQNQLIPLDIEVLPGKRRLYLILDKLAQSLAEAICKFNFNSIDVYLDTDLRNVPIDIFKFKLNQSFIKYELPEIKNMFLLTKNGNNFEYIHQNSKQISVFLSVQYILNENDIEPEHGAFMVIAPASLVKQAQLPIIGKLYRSMKSQPMNFEKDLSVFFDAKQVKKIDLAIYSDLEPEQKSILMTHLYNSSMEADGSPFKQSMVDTTKLHAQISNKKDWVNQIIALEIIKKTESRIALFMRSPHDTTIRIVSGRKNRNEPAPIAHRNNVVELIYSSIFILSGLLPYPLLSPFLSIDVSSIGYFIFTVLPSILNGILLAFIRMQLYKKASMLFQENTKDVSINRLSI